MADPLEEKIKESTRAMLARVAQQKEKLKYMQAAIKLAAKMGEPTEGMQAAVDAMSSLADTIESVMKPYVEGKT